MAGLEPARAFYGPTDFKSDRLLRYLYSLDTNLTGNEFDQVCRVNRPRLRDSLVNELPFVRQFRTGRL